MAGDDRALIKAKEKQAEALELVGKLRGQLREAKAAQEPVGMHRKAIAAGAGALLAIAEAGRVGSLFGREITMADLLPAADYAIEKFTDGRPPGGIAGDMVRVLNKAGDVQVASATRELTRTGITLVRGYLGMNRQEPASSNTSSSKPHPAPEPATVVDENGQPVSSS